MKPRDGLIVGVFAVMVSSATPVSGAAASEDFLAREAAAITALGQLNATALMCRDIEQVRAMKRAIVSGVPKLRDYGETYEEATNKAFLERSKSSAPCPAPADLAAQVKAAITHIETVFADYAE